ncbi:hypothetical protein CA54_60930 [Symmachiella macrocystis]|uniref:Uncharacterized protein n=1 Tax=Symmachiella macrocystis TaxID=2527985 RepID=A0A5C6AXL3_9PLAN|nr:hypothetical protein CA54_60930 [Symmachiella macrocystis]
MANPKDLELAMRYAYEQGLAKRLDSSRPTVAAIRSVTCC